MHPSPRCAHNGSQSPGLGMAGVVEEVLEEGSDQGVGEVEGGVSLFIIDLSDTLAR